MKLFILYDRRRALATTAKPSHLLALPAEFRLLICKCITPDIRWAPVVLLTHLHRDDN
jgi:hypothetical protein